MWSEYHCHGRHDIDGHVHRHIHGHVDGHIDTAVPVDGYVDDDGHIDDDIDTAVPIDGYVDGDIDARITSASDDHSDDEYAPWKLTS